MRANPTKALRLFDTPFSTSLVWRGCRHALQDNQVCKSLPASLEKQSALLRCLLNSYCNIDMKTLLRIQIHYQAGHQAAQLVQLVHLDAQLQGLGSHQELVVPYK